MNSRSTETDTAVEAKVLNFRQLRSIVCETTGEEFARAYPYPFLVAKMVGELGAPAQSFRTVKGLPTIGDIKASEAARLAYPVIKSSRNNFADIITIGRAYNNDLIIEENSVSKFHAYISHELDKQYLLADAGSTYGTTLQGYRLEPDQARPVTSGDTLVLGEVVFSFFAAKDLFGYLTCAHVSPSSRAPRRSRAL